MRFLSFLATAILISFIGLAAVMTGFITLPPAYDPFAPIDLKAEKTFVTPLKLWRLENAPRLCQAALQQAGVTFRPTPDRDSGKGCVLSNTVLLSSLGDIYLKPTSQIRCPLAARLVMYAHELGRKAEYLSSRIAGIDHYGTYACRNIYGRAQGRLSKHATANAIDVSAFILKNGERVSVLQNWDKDNSQGAFLKEARDRACGFFSAVLGPDYNAAHKNHFHFDGGFFSRCS